MAEVIQLAPGDDVKSAAGARSAFEKTTDDHLMTNWRLLARGNVVMEAPRYQMIQDTINHWAHHRGQMTVYLRLLGKPVPATYGPTADVRWQGADPTTTVEAAGRSGKTSGD